LSVSISIILWSAKMVQINSLLQILSQRDPRIKKTLESIYNIDATPKVLRLIETFAERFPDETEVTVLRAPGRVNLIGEHTDYNGLPVLPMAIDNDMLVAFAPRQDDVIKAVNSDFPDRVFHLERQIPHFETGDWGNYVKAAAQGVIDHFGSTQGLRGMNACFYGTVPISAGLSSSSALVVSSALALLHASGREIERPALAERLAAAEWYVGTEGGGMDQAASLLAERDKALKIDFYPLRAEPVFLPEGFTIVVANSMVVASKSQNARLQYNTRHAVCRMATALLVKRLELDPDKYHRLGDIYLQMGRDRMLAACKQHLKWHGYTKTELSEALGISLDEFNQRFCTTTNGEHISGPAEGFKLLARTRHVVSESARVDQALADIRSGGGGRMGELMNASYLSCRHNYEVSHPAIDDLVAIALEAGAAGSRITGAGFGGCTVSLVPDDRLDSFLDEVRRRYFEDAIQTYPEASRRYRETGIEPLLVLRSSGGAQMIF